LRCGNARNPTHHKRIRALHHPAPDSPSRPNPALFRPLPIGAALLRNLHRQFSAHPNQARRQLRGTPFHGKVSPVALHLFRPLPHLSQSPIRVRRRGFFRGVIPRSIRTLPPSSFSFCPFNQPRLCLRFIRFLWHLRGTLSCFSFSAKWRNVWRRFCEGKNFVVPL